VTLRGLRPALGVVLVLGCGKTPRPQSAAPDAAASAPTVPFTTIPFKPASTTVKVKLVDDDTGFHAVAVDAEPSKYGRFELREVDGADHVSACRVSFRHDHGKTTSLFVVPDCNSQGFGVGGAEKVHDLALGPGGEELHLFLIATARGGNWTANQDYWAVVVRPDDAWGTSQPLKSAELETTTLTGARFTLEQAPTTTTKGTRWTVGFGAASLETVPVLPSHVVSKATRVFIGGIQLDTMVSRQKPVIVSSSGDPTLIDKEGTCQLTFGNTSMRMTAEVATWSDGRTTVKCLSISPAP